MTEKVVGKFRILVEQPDKSFRLQSYDLARRHGGGCSQAQRRPGHRTLAAEFVRSPDCDDGFLPALGNDSDLDLASVDVKNRIRRVSLRVKKLTFFITRQFPSRGVSGE